MKSTKNPCLGPRRASFCKNITLGTTDIKIVLLASNDRRIVNTVRFLWKLHKTYLSAVRSKFSQNHTFEHTRPQNRRTGLKATANRENVPIPRKRAQFAPLWPIGASFRKILVLSTPDLKIVLLASNHRQIVKTVRFLWQVHKSHVWSPAEQVLAKCDFSIRQSSKSSYWPQIIARSRKQYAF